MLTFKQYIIECKIEDKFKKLKEMRTNISKMENQEEKEKAISRADEYEKSI